MRSCFYCHLAFGNREVPLEIADKFFHISKNCFGKFYQEQVEKQETVPVEEEGSGFETLLNIGVPDEE